MEIPKSLLDASDLTDAQLESLVSHLQVRSGLMTMKEAASARKKGPVKVGAYYRTVHQGENNLRRAVATLTIGLWLGVIRTEDLQKLLSFFFTAGRGVEKLEGEGAQRLAGVVQDLIREIVMV